MNELGASADPAELVTADEARAMAGEVLAGQGRVGDLDGSVGGAYVFRTIRSRAARGPASSRARS